MFDFPHEIRDPIHHHPGFVRFFASVQGLFFFPLNIYKLKTSNVDPRSWSLWRKRSQGTAGGRGKSVHFEHWWIFAWLSYTKLRLSTLGSRFKTWLYIHRIKTWLYEGSRRSVGNCGKPVKTVYFGHFSLQFAGEMTRQFDNSDKNDLKELPTVVGNLCIFNIRSAPGYGCDGWSKLILSALGSLSALMVLRLY